MEVRPASADELPAVMTVLDAGLLETDTGTVQAAIGADRVLVAVDGGRVLGALVLIPGGSAEGTYVDAIAVRPRRRRQGIGSALVRAAAARHGRLVARFDGSVRPFWTSLGFEVEPADEPGRYVGMSGTGG